MKQFILPDNCPERLILGDRDYHYLHNVRRLRVEDSFSGIDSQGNRYHVTVMSISGTEMEVSVQAAGKIIQDHVSLHLYQCLPKAGKFDQVIRMAVEAGASSITPLVSERTISKIDEHDVPRKMKRWERVIQESVQQSGAPGVPVLNEPVSLKDLYSGTSGHSLPDRILFFHQEPLAPDSIHEYCSDSVSSYGLCIGPEGGFSQKETDAMVSIDWKPAYLGPWVLRTEHAGMYAIAAVQTIVMEKSNWKIIDLSPGLQ
ncbi:RsmE family RNA methyltransferase [Spirochaeta dissipatitropha]